MTGMLHFSLAFPVRVRQLSLLILLRIKDAIELAALVADPVFVDQGTSVVEDSDHRLAGVPDLMLHFAFAGFQNGCDFPDLEAVNIL